VPIALAAAVFVVMFSVGVIRALREEIRDSKRPTTSSSFIVENAPTEKPPAVPATPPTAPPSAALPEAPTAEASAEASAEAPATATSAVEPTPSTSAEPARSGDTMSVLVRSSVTGARFYRHGKQIGINSLIVDLAPGEKRAFEVDLPGYVSRKVVVDGSRSEVVVTLPRISEAPAAPEHAGAAPSKDEAAPAAQGE
jgi:hypothetical protein